jgi:hypothetical protein
VSASCQPAYKMTCSADGNDTRDCYNLHEAAAARKSRSRDAARSVVASEWEAGLGHPGEETCSRKIWVDVLDGSVEDLSLVRSRTQRGAVTPLLTRYTQWASLERQTCVVVREILYSG